MKILFVYSLDDVNPSRRKTLKWSNVPLGISYISSALTANGHETSAVVLGSSYYDDSMKLLATCLEEFSPDLICFTAVFSQYFFIEKIARQVKSQWPDTYLAIGGVHATLRPEEVISGPFDAVCIGEGEYPTVELSRQLESQKQPQAIANLWIKLRNGELEKNPPRNFMQNLDELPFPDLHMWKPWVADTFDDGLTILGGRGCPYECTYCCNSALSKTAGGRYVRTRSPENILKEVSCLHEQFPGNKEIFIEIETLDCNKPWTMDLCTKLENFNSRISEPVIYGSNYRINPHTIDANIFSALEKANFKYINIGLESGNERVRRDILNRSYSNDDFLKTVSLARKHKLKVYIYNMIGLPGESLEDHKETVKLNRQCQPDGHYTGIFYPYPGTDLYTTCIQSGLTGSSIPVHAERSQPIMGLPNFSKAQIRSAYIWFDYYIYRGYKPIWTILTQHTLNKMRTGRMIKYLVHKAVELPLKVWKKAVLSWQDGGHSE